MYAADEDEEAEDEAEAYFPGGLFNNPVFDSYWGSSSPAFKGANGQFLSSLRLRCAMYASVILGIGNRHVWMHT